MTESVGDLGQAEPVGPTGVHDVFVSYSRGDIDSARELVSRLESAGRSVWVDWSGIPPTAEWMSEVRSGIDACQGVVFLLSSRSLASSVCGVELEHAEESGKRIVPVALEDIDSSAAPDGLARRNWVLARPGDDLDVATAQILEGLDVDLEKVREHTRILVRSKEWETSGQDVSRLLRGSELEAAERWLSDPGDGPRPTSGQTAYVLSSRSHAARRQRRLVTVVSLALVASLLLAAFAVVQGKAARDQRDIAAAQSDRAQTQAASALALTELDRDPEASLLYAQLAAETGRTPQSDDALRRALFASHVAHVLRPESAGEKSTPMVSLGYTADGTRLLTLGNDGTARVWSTADGSLVGSVPFEADSFGQATARGTALVVSFSSRGEARVIDVAALTVGAPLTLPAPVSSVEPGPSEGTVLVSLYDGTLRILDARRGTAGDPIGTVPEGVIDATLAPDGRTRAVASPDGAVRITRTGAPVVVRRHSSTPFVARWSPDGRLLAIAWSEGAATVVDPVRGTELAVFGHESPVTDLQWSVDGSFVLTGDSAGVLRAWDPQSGRVVAEFRGHTDYVPYVAVDPRGEQVASTSYDSSARLWSLGGGLPLADRTTPRPVVGLALLPGGKQAVTSQSDGTVELVDVTTGKVVRTLDHGASGVPAVSQDGRLAAVIAVSPAAEVRVVDIAGGTTTVRVTDLGTRSDPRTGQTVTARPYSVAFDPTGTRLAVATGSSVRVVDVATGKVLASTPLVEDFGLSELEIQKDGNLARRTVAWLPDGSAVGVTAGPGARLWDPTTGRVVQWFEGHRQTAQGLAISPDGTRLVTASIDKTARVYDVASGSLVAVLSGHSAQVLTADFSPSGRHVVTTGLDGSVRVWSLDGTLLATFQAASIVASSAHFLGDDEHLLVTAEEGANFTSDPVPPLQSGSVSRYDCVVCRPRDELLSLAATSTTRQLTPAERSAVSAEGSASASASPTTGTRDPLLVGAWTTTVPVGPDGTTETQTVELRPSGAATAYGPSGFSEGTWTTQGSTLVLTGTPLGCPSGDDRWTWTVSGSVATLTPTAVSPTCLVTRLEPVGG